jgi:glycosyltransferase involved in cell wall biosynthesis
MMKNTFRPVRVAVISSSLKLGGAEKQTVYQTRALREAGADVRVFHLGEGAYYEQVLRQIGIPLIQIYKRNGPMLILARLSKALRRFGPEIVFSPQFGDLLQAGLAGRLCHALVLGGVRSDGFYELNSNGRRSPWMLRLAHGLVANSHCGWHNLVSRGAKPSKIKILPNVLDLREFDARRQLSPALSPQPERVIAAAVGSLQPCKRFDRFLKALALARREAPALLGVIAGSDWGCRVDLEYEANQLGLAPNHVVFVGECDNVPALLTQAGFLVLCSEYEGFPNVVLEAMAARLPVVTTPVGDV